MLRYSEGTADRMGIMCPGLTSISFHHSETFDAAHCWIDPMFQHDANYKQILGNPIVVSLILTSNYSIPYISCQDNRLA